MATKQPYKSHNDADVTDNYEAHIFRQLGTIVEGITNLSVGGPSPWILTDSAKALQQSAVKRLVGC